MKGRKKGFRWSDNHKNRMSIIAKERGFKPPSGPHKSCFKKGQKQLNTGRTRLKVGHTMNKGRIPWNKGLRTTKKRKILAYSIDWTETLRRSIRERDKYTCQLCGKHQGDRSFAVHHIDYDKMNSNVDNLITLCYSCHLKTNTNREDWKKYFKIFKTI